MSKDKESRIIGPETSPEQGQRSLSLMERLAAIPHIAGATKLGVSLTTFCGAAEALATEEAPAPVGHVTKGVAYYGANGPIALLQEKDKIGTTSDKVMEGYDSTNVLAYNVYYANRHVLIGADDVSKTPYTSHMAIYDTDLTTLKGKIRFDGGSTSIINIFPNGLMFTTSGFWMPEIDENGNFVVGADGFINAESHGSMSKIGQVTSYGGYLFKQTLSGGKRYLSAFSMAKVLSNPTGTMLPFANADKTIELPNTLANPGFGLAVNTQTGTLEFGFDQTAGSLKLGEVDPVTHQLIGLDWMDKTKIDAIDMGFKIAKIVSNDGGVNLYRNANSAPYDREFALKYNGKVTFIPSGTIKPGGVHDVQALPHNKFMLILTQDPKAFVKPVIIEVDPTTDPITYTLSTADDVPDTANEISHLSTVTTAAETCDIILKSSQVACQDPSCNLETFDVTYTSLPDGELCSTAVGQFGECENGTCVTSCPDITCPSSTCSESVVNPDTCDCEAHATNEGMVCAESLNPCTDKVCDGVGEGACVSVTKVAGTQCGEETECTEQVCEGATCTEKPLSDGLPCEDADPISVGEECVQGVCVGYMPCDIVICSPTGNECTYSVCLNTTEGGICQIVAEPNGTACDEESVTQCVEPSCQDSVCVRAVLSGDDCDDGNEDTESDTCQADGACVGTPVTPDVVEQTTDTAEPSEDTTESTPDTAESGDDVAEPDNDATEPNPEVVEPDPDTTSDTTPEETGSDSAGDSSESTEATESTPEIQNPEKHPLDVLGEAAGEGLFEVDTTSTADVVEEAVIVEEPEPDVEGKPNCGACDVGHKSPLKPSDVPGMALAAVLMAWATVRFRNARSIVTGHGVPSTPDEETAEVLGRLEAVYSGYRVPTPQKTINRRYISTRTRVLSSNEKVLAAARAMSKLRQGLGAD